MLFVYNTILYIIFRLYYKYIILYFSFSIVFYIYKTIVYMVAIYPYTNIYIISNSIEESKICVDVYIMVDKRKRDI